MRATGGDARHKVAADHGYSVASKEVFHSTLFDEHAWDILLILYIAFGEGFMVSKEEVAELTSTRLSMLDRWLNILTSQLIIRESGWPHAHLELSSDARDRMSHLLLEAVVS
ncbi:hypothetical protein [Sphingomonas nostoxanthinifaciens]|uniref:hypothetical protein n=1 Tax=Sphingomonas nostoxanthinifaciens TaxID=2872652 RepID=UPI001CC1E803|nr:hypothetical protein [Sphingomonas nostoxanthinifaciens]UAK25573.1 hypothetical protein K8P63_05310 [Sphingomonas nostoxanthinifaciens]